MAPGLAPPICGEPAFSAGPDPRRDVHGRVIDYLRLSITDRCNERCLYCMPEGYKGWAQRADHLNAAEIVHLAQVAWGLGFRKFRLTGGEPTVRPDVVEIATGIADRMGAGGSLALSTNGTQLARLARPLMEAGVRSVNVSLDALEPDLYRRITGGDVAPVLAGIDAALEAGLTRLKLNCVLMRGVNENEIGPLIDFAASRRVPIRFIELMPLSNADVLHAENFLSVDDVLRWMQAREEVVPLTGTSLGWGPARYFSLKQSGAVVGLIGALTSQDFCASCNKIRITADGKIRPCLGRHNELDLKAALRGDADLTEVFRQALELKPRDHEFAECYQPGRPMTAIGG